MDFVSGSKSDDLIYLFLMPASMFNLWKQPFLPLPESVFNHGLERVSLPECLCYYEAVKRVPGTDCIRFDEVIVAFVFHDIIHGALEVRAGHLLIRMSVV